MLYMKSFGVNLKKDITIVIPTFNEEEHIGSLLDDISKQYYISGTTVIIADSDSTDNTLDVIHQKSEELTNLHILVVGGGTTPIDARNSGSHYCGTSYILFMDADIRLDSKFTIINTYNMLATNNKKLVTCKVWGDEPNFKLKMYYRVYNVLHKLLT